MAVGDVAGFSTIAETAYVTARAHTLFDFRLYLPKAWYSDRERRDRAHVPQDAEFTTVMRRRAGRRRCPC